MSSMADLRPPDPHWHALDWHALDTAEVAHQLGVDPAQGLAAEEAAERLARHGPNALAEPPPEPWWRTLLRQFRPLVIWVLIAAAIVAGFLRDWADAVAILVIVMLNALIGFFQEERAARALAALERLAAPVARVMRGGHDADIPARELVPGDRIELEAGDHVPADARLVEGFGLEIQEAALTGESTPVAKAPGGGLPGPTPLADRHTMVHAGTVVAAGHGAAVVVATGMDTELGHIATLLERIGPEQTPLQRRLEELGRVIVAACLVIVAVIFVLEWRRSGGIAEVLLRAVSLAVAAVPEGLPAVVTLVLALGVQRMVARNALVRRLPSVETLGSVTVICSDKTGTLTRNEMSVREIVTPASRYHVSGVGYEPRGKFERVVDGVAEPVDPRTDGDLRRLVTIAARCTTASVQPDAASGEWRVTGDPTEGALVVAALKAGVSAVDPAAPVVFEIPFDSERRRMSVVIREADGRHRLLTKGAPEAVLPVCAAEWRGDEMISLDEPRRAEMLAAATAMAGRALRVLALACRELPPHVTLDNGLERDGLEPNGAAKDGLEHDGGLVFAGLVGMLDPPREEVKAAVRQCRTAGIRPVMITGDHPATALAIARELGLDHEQANGEDDASEPDGRVVTGSDLEALDDGALAAAVPGIAVYARVSAEHKLRVVRAWQARGGVVAMTGDGVNDAPAVRAADIGIAMGLTGTDVTKAASDMVLTDDNFASIVAAVEEGRGIYDNIQKFMHYLLACNTGEVLVMFVAAVLGWPAPLAAIQILWLNIVTDGLPALALGLEPPEPDLMERPPRPPEEPVLTWGRGGTILLHGGFVAAVTLVAFAAAWQGDDALLPHARTMTFCTAAFAQLFFAIACRSDRSTAVARGFFKNPLLLGAIGISTLLQLAVVSVPFARPVFEVGTELGRDWFVVLALALVPVTLVEAAKWLPRRQRASVSRASM
jgi:Ca2+-transporting ATPase